MANNWMRKEGKREKHAGTKGVFTAKAEHAGMSTQAYAHKEEHAPGKLGKQARMAERFAEAAKKRKK